MKFHRDRPQYFKALFLKEANMTGKKMILHRTILIFLLILFCATGVFGENTSSAPEGNQPPGERQNPYGAIIGAALLVVLLVIYTVIVEKNGTQGGCSSCACGRKPGEACENKDKN